ncbi:MAG TPA: dTDP-4-dehydrorhamnose 3,5-epimerase family protein [Candidatus Acidoferrales bacterium]|nr:dTDP-4-dehydrorhamnose 3,5-epimerase family protein [Candidatus Acidoferrales bacterium]
MDSLPNEPELIPGGFAVDDRGQVTFVNGFPFEKIRRFYVVENFTTETVRAFHGHRKEEKFVFVASGSALVATAELGNDLQPSKATKPRRFVLSGRQPRILHIPAGYANGFKALEPGTKIIFFSTATLEASQQDDHRFPYDYWGEDVWKVNSY